jgi:hypothetical protein
MLSRGCGPPPCTRLWSDCLLIVNQRLVLRPWRAALRMLVDHTRKAREKEMMDLTAGADTRPLSSPTYAVLVTPPRVPLFDRLGENHAPNVSNKMCLR